MKMRIFELILAFLLLIAILQIPLEYHMLIRLAVFVGAVILINRYYQVGLLGWILPFGIIAIVWNPFIPIFLNNKIGTVLNVSAAFIFTFSAFIKKHRI